MEYLKIWSIVIFVLANYEWALADKNVICYYDSSAVLRQGYPSFYVEYLNVALQYCTHIVYGYAGIDEETSKLKVLNDVNGQHYKNVTNLKRKFPGLKVLLSVGGGRDGVYDDERKVEKYLTLLESEEKRSKFVNSVDSFLKTYGFDGLDLGWEFPETKPKVIRGKISGWFHSLKTKVVGEHEVDKKSGEHKEEFTALVRDLHNKFKNEGLSLTLSVLPNVNSTIYYDPVIVHHLDLIIVKAFDFHTPKRNPNEADYPAPLYAGFGRKFEEHVDYQIKHWIQHRTPRNKIILGIPTFGRTWKMTQDSGPTGVPPLKVYGPGIEGGLTKTPGLASFLEICALFTLSVLKNKDMPTKIEDPSGRHGVYAFNLAKDNVDGIWIAYEDMDSVASKASYVREKGLGGVAIDDLTLDDFSGLCKTYRFPLLRAAKERL